MLWPAGFATWAPTEEGSQSVGLSVKPGTPSCTATERMSSGMPCRIVGSGSATAWIWAVSRSIVQCHPDHDDTEVEGTGHRGGDDRHRERRAFVGAG